MTNQEAALKMAEMCGRGTFFYEGHLCIITKDGCYAGLSADLWNPQENIAQMMEVMEGSDWCTSGEFKRTSKGYEYYLYGDENNDLRWPSISHCGIGITPQEAMFQAVKKYLEDKGDE